MRGATGCGQHDSAWARVSVSLYHTEGNDLVTLFRGRSEPEVSADRTRSARRAGVCGSATAEAADTDEGVDERLNIPEAKRRLTLTSDVDPSSAKVTIEA